MKLSVIAVLLAAKVVSVAAHFELIYPYWRADSFIPPASQYLFPCANINTTDESNNNRTLWPLDGGSLAIDFHHPWTYVSFNLGLGSNISTFNISLNPMLLNETGNGTICIPKWTLPADLGIIDGQDASLQVITIGDDGTALYNCADIRFSANATILSGGQCQNTTGTDIYPLVQQQANGSVAGTTTVTVTASGAGATSTSGALSGRADVRYIIGLASSMTVLVAVTSGLGL
ncbi:uncharacterized protein Z518_02011 [Rhinocladiella mackenziei CBS 650.93]|uniref:Copper acquisition factor BIM1-like domain-containing protein n=1 Tax=Rhinocladiella mackenziei CBS 650.93 TaxID=1442369 RepID=A0A0D2HA50_9EURO|nr:uncharacterized protein Z518_02011 [Rhinocladiella mackenziei CBS 650.93]KIX07358.1 hypothetical protein Z518_02011 [Rhinocladiella mackenziei CBS 650.93]